MIRPGDANEVVEAWRVIMQLPARARRCSSCTRQALPTLDRTKYAPASGLAKGAYILADAADGKPDVHPDRHRQRGVALRRRLREAHGRGRQGPRRQHAVAGSCSRSRTQAYRDAVLPPAVTARVAVEQASTFGWERYVGLTGAIIGMNTFGASAPLKELLKKFGFTPEKVVEAAREVAGGLEEHDLACGFARSRQSGHLLVRTEDRDVQLGMIGLGRMGGNMVRRLMKAGHQCVVFDHSPEAVKKLVGEGATGADVADRVRRASSPSPAPPG